MCFRTHAHVERYQRERERERERERAASKRQRDKETIQFDPASPDIAHTCTQEEAMSITFFCSFSLSTSFSRPRNGEEEEVVWSRNVYRVCVKRAVSLLFLHDSSQCVERERQRDRESESSPLHNFYTLGHPRARAECDAAGLFERERDRERESLILFVE